MLPEKKIEIDIAVASLGLEAAYTVIPVAVDNIVVGVINVADTVRPESRKAG